MAKHESVADRARRRGKDKGKSTRFKLKEGENVLRILPTPAGETSPETFMEYGVYYGVGKDKKALRYGKDIETGKGKDWIEDKLKPKLTKAGKTKRLEGLQYKEVMTVQVAVVEDGKMHGPYRFSPSGNLAGKILTKIIGSRGKNYIDPKKGYCFTVERTGTGQKDTRYSDPFPDDEPTKVPSSIMEKLKPFDECDDILKYSEKAQKAAYYGEDVDDEDEDEEDIDEDMDEGADDDDEDEPKSKKKKGKKSKSDDDEDEDEDDDSDSDSDDDEDEEEDEDEDDDSDSKKHKKKKSSSHSKTKKRRDDDDDDDEDESDDDEDEASNDDSDAEDDEPVKKSKKKSKSKSKKKSHDEDEDEDD